MNVLASENAHSDAFTRLPTLTNEQVIKQKGRLNINLSVFVFRPLSEAWPRNAKAISCQFKAYVYSRW